VHLHYCCVIKDAENAKEYGHRSFEAALSILNMIRIAFIEDDAPTRQSWAVLFNGTPGFRCVSTHQTAEDALRTLPFESIDVAIVDLGLPVMDGVELIRCLKQRRPKLLVCVFTAHEDSEKVFECLKNGASGYILKKTPPAEILDQLTELIAGGSPISPVIARKVTEYFQKVPRSKERLEELTDRERDVLHHIAQGRTDKQISTQLGISTNTVRNHVSNIYSKLHVHSRAGATATYLGRK
jgi:DNA-binding NarL/FixJ family response regulator